MRAGVARSTSGSGSLDETIGAVDLVLTDDQQQRTIRAGQIPDLNPHAYTYT
jgi:hypothetical protein